MKKLLILTLLLIFVLPAFPASVVGQSNQDWERSTPEEEGIPSPQLMTLIPINAGSTAAPLHSFIVARHGKIVMETNIPPYEVGMKHSLYSVTKCITSTLIGIAIDEGFIESVDVPMMNYFTDREIANLDTAKENITLHHLLSMTSGFPPTGPDALQYWTAEDKLQASLDFPVNDQGTYQYSDINMTILSGILSEATGMTTFEFATEYLFGPLGIEDVVWETDQAGTYIGSSGLWLSSYDLATIGQLFLNNGQWNGQQIVSDQWVQLATATRQVDFGDEWGGYGYGWFLLPDGSFVASGQAGQVLHVLPEQDTLVVFVGAGFGNAWPYEYSQNIEKIEFSDNPLPVNEVALTTLTDGIDKLEIPKPHSIEPFSEAVTAISGTTFDIEENELGFETIQFDFMDDEVTVTMQYYGETVEMYPSRDDVLRPMQQSAFPRSYSRYCASMIKPGLHDTLTFFFTSADDIFFYEMKVKVEENALTLTVYDYVFGRTFQGNYSAVPVE